MNIQVPEWMGPEAIEFLTGFLPDNQDVFDESFVFLNTTRVALLNRWNGQVNRALEIGVCRGVYSGQILKRINPAELHLVDPWGTQDPNYPKSEQQLANYEHTLSLFPNELKSGRVFIHRNESGDFLPKYPDDFFDWAFVDGDHRFHGVLVDLIMCDRIVESKGTITGHDFSALFGIPDAVVEFCRHYPWRIVGITAGQHGTYILRHTFTKTLPF